MNRTSRILFIGLVLLLQWMQACSVAGRKPFVIPQEVSTSNDQETAFETSSVPVKGLYVTKDVLIGASLPLQAVGTTSCKNLLGMLAAGEWVLQQAAQVPGLAGIANYAWFTYDNESYFVVAAGNGPGLLELLGLEPDSSEVIPSADIPEPILPDTEYCTATFQRISQQPISASGAFLADGLAQVTPRICAATAEGAALELLIEAEGGLKAILHFQAPLELGEHLLIPESGEDFSLQAWESPETFTDFYLRVNDLLVQLLSGEKSDGMGLIDTEEENYEVYPDYNFQGKILVESLEPFTGKAEFMGLVTLSGSPMNLSVGFSCDLLGLGNQEAQSVEKASNGAIVQIELNYDQILDLSGYQYTNKGSVVLSGELAPTGGFKYEGTFIAEGGGSFSAFDVDYNQCEAAWSGSQQLAVTGMASGTNIELNFTPLGKPTMKDNPGCWPATAPLDNLPHMMDTLYGARSLTIIWPPESPGAGEQTIDFSVEGFIEVWLVQLQPLPK